MKGEIQISVKNNKIKYEFTLRRNITLIKGNSATGKTKLLEMIQDYKTLGEESGVELICSKKCVVIEGNEWKEQLSHINNGVVFIDEGNRFVSSVEFASTIKTTDNYYVLVTREALPVLPYSVEEIYGIRSGGKYGGLRQTYNELYRIYSQNQMSTFVPKMIITEDSHSGFQFFENICKKIGIDCIAADGKSNVYKAIMQNQVEDLLIVADGAAFGPEMERVMKIIKKLPDTVLYLPESFEWLVLMSGCLNNSEIKNMSEAWGNYIDSQRFFSWEQFFADLLTEKTRGTYLQYSKSRINPAYLSEKIQMQIINNMDNIIFEPLNEQKK